MRKNEAAPARERVIRERLKAILKQRKVPTRVLADAWGIGYSAATMKLTGKRSIGADQLYDACRALGVSASMFEIPEKQFKSELAKLESMSATCPTCQGRGLVIEVGSKKRVSLTA